MTAINAYGTDIYFCLRKVKKSQAFITLALEQFFEAIYNIPFTVKEDQVAISKLHWWQQEVERMQTGTANHPIAIALQGHHINSKQLISVIETSANLLQYARFESFEDLAAHYVQSFGLITTLIAQQYGEATQQTLYQVGLGLGICYHLDHLRAHINKGFFFLAETDMAQFNVTQPNLLTPNNKADINLLLQQMIERASKALNVNLPKQQVYLNKRIRLANKWLTLINKNPSELLQHQVQLNPIIKLITAQ